MIDYIKKVAKDFVCDASCISTCVYRLQYLHLGDVRIIEWNGNGGYTVMGMICNLMG